MVATSSYVSVSHDTDIYELPANSEPASPSTDDHWYYETLFEPYNVLAQWTLTQFAMIVGNPWLSRSRTRVRTVAFSTPEL